jgi:hypothetical protein
MPNTACNYRYSHLSTRSVFRFTFLSEACGWLGAVKKVFLRDWEKQTPRGSLSCCACGVLDDAAAKAQRGMDFPEELPAPMAIWHWKAASWRLDPISSRSR